MSSATPFLFDPTIIVLFLSLLVRGHTCLCVLRLCFMFVFGKSPVLTFIFQKCGEAHFTVFERKQPARLCIGSSGGDGRVSESRLEQSEAERRHRGWTYVAYLFCIVFHHLPVISHHFS